MISCTRSVKPPRITREVFIKHRDMVLDRIGAYTFTFKFDRELAEDRRFNQPQYPEYAEQHKRLARFSQFMKVTNISPVYPVTRYAVQVKISPAQALAVLGNNVNVMWDISNKYPKRSPKDSGKPPFGIWFYPHFSGPSPFPPEEKPPDLLEDMSGGTKGQDKIRDILMQRHLASAEILVSSEYEVKENYLSGEIGNIEDFRWLRVGIWHEIIELAIIYMATEGFCFPYWMYHNLLDTEKRGEGAKNFANNAVCEVQASLENERSLWLYWDDDDEDPPFDAFESAAFCREEDAEYATGKAKAMEEFDNWAAAYEKWKEAEKAWEVAIRAWQAVPHHPDRDKKIDEARERLAEAKIRKGIAQSEAQRGATKQAPSWNVAGSGTEKITIHYSDWPNGFRAKILDYKERKVTEVSGTPGTKEGKVEWGKDADPGTYYVEVNVSGERSEKVIIKKPLAWQAKVKFGSNGPYISITPKIGTKWPKGKGFGFSIHNSSGSKLGFVNVQDSNRTGEVTWGRESNQRFGDWGKHTIWAYANDPGLQKMFKDKNFFPNWKTEVEIPAPSFKVNGAKASVAVAAKGPLIAPDTEQSLSIEYDNWPGKFEGIRQVSIDFFRVRSSIGKMRIMRFTLSLLVIGLLLIGVLGCKKQAEILSSQQAQPEPRTLRIYRDGIFERKIDVSGWEVGEDVIHLSGYNSCANDSFCYYYPWRGEDSIDYRIDEVYLFVNGIAVGSPLNPRRGLYHTLEDSCYFWKDSILTTWIDLTHWNDEDFGWGPWDQYPNLKVVRVSVDCHYPHTTSRHFFGYIESFIRHGRIAKFGVFYGQEEPPDSVDVYLYCLCLCDFCLRDQIEGINLKGIEIVGCGVTTNLSLRYLRKSKGLRYLELHMCKVNNLGLRHLKYLPNLRELSLDCPKVDNRGIRYLKKLTNLRVLYLAGETNINSSGIAELKKALPDCKIVIRGWNSSGFY
ncbi:hypothetical protein CEE36_10090 [candidate division TA06 bacterium B3_TA06]|uniref:Uncharacterized protein n=1 Tax=candidate division TA06 bacterium B3_TA06 TaxID=2012487 RepID=A0A532UYA0_UNCT6|nr:MAG: hypothetical protein CEE36_10090 [candidate division TA06 bacterium B3_TA06]